MRKLKNYLKNLRRRVNIANSSCGREHGWYIVCGTEKYAELSSPQQDDMFWVRYQMKILVKDSESLQRMTTMEFYLEDASFVNRESGEIAPNAFPAGDTVFEQLEFEQVVSISM